MRSFRTAATAGLAALLVLSTLLTAQAAQAEDCKPLTLITTSLMESTASGRPVLPVKVNGTLRKFLFDTGFDPQLVSSEPKAKAVKKKK